MDLEGKVVLITGAGKGSGRALADLFAARGVQVAANDISPVNLDDLVRRHPEMIRAYTEDVAKKVGAQALIKQVEDDLGRLDILVNHASVEPRVPLLDMDEWDWHRVLDVNLTGTFLMIQSVGRIMRQAGSGVILNLIDLERPWEADGGAYAASMYGLIALTRAAAAELSPHNVLVHAVCRGIAVPVQAEPPVAANLGSVVLDLCNSRRSGQIVTMEAR